jgi:hypothetical protein
MIRGKLTVWLLALALAPAPAALQGQSLSIAPGTRVRVSASNLLAPLVANFLQMRGDTAVFIEDAASRGVWSIQLADISRLERSDGERKGDRGNVTRGALIGAGGGLLLGFAFSATFSPSDSSKEYNRALNAAVGAAAGAVIGGLIGYRRGVERWTGVPVPRRVSVLPTRRGVGVSLAFEF